MQLLRTQSSALRTQTLPGLDDATPLGLETQICSYSELRAQHSELNPPWAGRCNAFGVGTLLRPFPRVAADAQPWAGRRNPVGVGNPNMQLLRTQSSGLRTQPSLAGRRNPFGVGTLLRPFPRVAADGIPGLDDATPLGLETPICSYSELSTQHSSCLPQERELYSGL